jgi:rhamnosyltransferase
MELCTVVVLYKPSAKHLESLRQRTGALVVIDNSPEHAADSTFEPTARYLWLGGNHGIGAAHNAGINLARQTFDATHVLLLDQDSSADDRFVELMVQAWRDQTLGGQRIAAIGPTHIDEGTNVRLRSVRRDERRVCLPSSGTLLAVESFKEIGPFREDLFIDMVDFEWCWRAHKLGFDTVRVGNVEMQHTLGGGIASFMGLRYSLPQPERCWYQARNLRILRKSPAVPRSFLAATFARQIARVLFTIGSGRGASWSRYTVRGYLAAAGDRGPLESG